MAFTALQTPFAFPPHFARQVADSVFLSLLTPVQPAFSCFSSWISINAETKPISATFRCAASAAVHSSTRIMLAALKFFLGQDEEATADSDDEDEDAPKLVQPSKADVYKATKKVCSSCASPIHASCLAFSAK